MIVMLDTDMFKEREQSRSFLYMDNCGELIENIRSPTYTIKKQYIIRLTRNT